jgi:hypothetical protein
VIVHATPRHYAGTHPVSCGMKDDGNGASSHGRFCLMFVSSASIALP